MGTEEQGKASITPSIWLMNPSLQTGRAVMATENADCKPGSGLNQVTVPGLETT